ncbi:MAG: mechanosensitive ion channel [Hyphomonas sp.]
MILCNIRSRFARFAGLMFLLAMPVMTGTGQILEPNTMPAPAQRAETRVDAPDDQAIKNRITAIFAEIDSLNGVEVDVREGVVTLSGGVSNSVAAVRATDIAGRFQGVVTVEDKIDRTLDIEGNVSPLVDNFNAKLRSYYRALPLLGLGLALFLTVSLVGHLLANWMWLWRRILRNPFLAELVSQAVRVISIGIALVLALSLVGATALMGTILGGVGVLGIAIGFAVRDSLENYISSIMLSLRQPFRANEHVVIGDQEGKVVRLTSRATVLMTLDGNHLRIPNAMVFKSVILNYSRNPERRFEFDLGVDANDDPIAAMNLGLNTLDTLPFVLKLPDATAFILTVGDSNIVLRFQGWVNQIDSDFSKARGLAISATKDALETGGFTLPEPIYRLRFDGPVDADVLARKLAQRTAERSKPQKPTPADGSDSLDVAPDYHIEKKVDEERAETKEIDLLDSDRPVE